MARRLPAEHIINIECFLVFTKVEVIVSTVRRLATGVYVKTSTLVVEVIYRARTKMSCSFRFFAIDSFVIALQEF